MKYTIKHSPKAEQLAASMTFRELLNQVCCPTCARLGTGAAPEPYGAVFFHKRARQELSALIDDYKSLCPIPPFIVSDLECGAGHMVLGATKFPSMMALGQANSEELAYEAGAIAAKEAGEIGYNWTFSPVADLAADPDSPVVSLRSAGMRPDHVVKIAAAYMKGLQDHGMMATIKHFPGDGYGTYDQHLTTPVMPLGREAWRSGPGKVFKALIEAGAMAVMPGHIAFPAFDEADPGTGLYPPATISRRLLLDVLRGELGFEGLIVTDAVEMGGLVGYLNYFDACALALENGCDVLLFPRMDERFYQEMEGRLKAGMLTMDTLRERACRVISLKIQMGLFDEPRLSRSAPPDPFYHYSIAEKAAAECMTVVRDRQGLVPYPVEKKTRVLHVVIMNNHHRYTELYARIREQLGIYTERVTQLIDPGPDKLYRAMIGKKHDLVICSIGSELSYGLNVVRLHDEVARNMMGGWTKLGTPVIFVAHFHPFVHKEYEASIDTIVNTYGDIACTVEYLIEGLFGKRELKRTLHAHD